MLTLKLFFILFFSHSCVHGVRQLKYEKLVLQSPCPTIAHILSFDPKEYSIEFAKANNHCKGLSTTSDLVKKYKALGGINGGFSLGDGTPCGICVINKKWFSTQKLPRAAVGWSKNQCNWIFDIIDTKKKLLINNIDFPVDYFNEPHNKNQIALYSSTYDSTTGASNNAIEFVAKDNIVIACIEKDNNPLTQPNELIYSVGKEALTRLPQPIRIGDTLSFSIEIIPQSTKVEEWNNLDFIMDGTPLLIFDKKIIEDFAPEKVAKKFIFEKYARTAIGLIKKETSYKIILVVVECTETPENQGMTLAELATFMESLQCTYAMNLSGGNSSIMVYQGSIVNTPQQKGFLGFSNLLLGEKAISNALVVGTSHEPLS